MRSVILAFSFLAFVLGLRAAQQTFIAAPQSLAGWTLVGTDAPALASQSELTLPANAQLVRPFPATEVAVQFVTQPVIGENSGDWPVLEVGATSLVFSRAGTMGKLVLVIGTQPPQELPLTFKLDSEGRSADLLTLSFSRVGAAVSIATAGQSFQFSTGAATDVTWEIVASAGDTQPWSFQHLEVTVGSADPVLVSPEVSSPISSAPASSVATSPNNAAPAKIMTPADWIAANRAADKLRDPRAPLPVATASTCTALEVFTPPPVRYGRTKVVRAAVQGVNP